MYTDSVAIEDGSLVVMFVEEGDKDPDVIVEKARTNGATNKVDGQEIFWTIIINNKPSSHTSIWGLTEEQLRSVVLTRKFG